jgi:penicillin-binding protein 1A
MAQDGRGRGDGPKLTRDKPAQPKKSEVKARDVSPRALKNDDEYVAPRRRASRSEDDAPVTPAPRASATRASSKPASGSSSASSSTSSQRRAVRPRDEEDDDMPVRRRSTSSGTKKGKKKRSRVHYDEDAGVIRRMLRWLVSPAMLIRFASIGTTLLMCMLMVLIYLSRELPDISHLKTTQRSPGIQVMDARGTVMARYGDIYGDTMRYNEFPKHLIDAVLATEDRNYFNHFGVDVWGILRAMLVNVREGQMVQGGSTITQQLAKNIFLNSDKTLKRKIQDMMLAIWLESRYSKEEILTIYLNRVYLGAGNFGVDAASRFYFGHPAALLTLQESALIAGLLKAPSRYNPIADVQRARGRAKQVLLNMVDAEVLRPEDAEKAIQNMSFAARSNDGSVSNSARYYADWIMEELPEHIGSVQDDVVITTSLDPVIQAQADAALAEQFSSDIRTKDNASQSALISMRPTGEVVALVGGVDYNGSEFNRATQARRQAGSAFKLFVYIAAMEMGYTPSSMVEDRPIRIGKWQPKNYKGEYRGAITLREAVAQSVNTVAVQLLQEAGVSRIIATARRLGISTPIYPSAAIALGAVEVSPLELTGAYAHVASGGHTVKPWGIQKMVRVKDNRVLYQRRGVGEGTVLSSAVVAKMNQVLTGVIGWGTGKNAALGRPAAGKTGTTSDYKDAWFVGYTPQLVTGVWVGNDNAKPMNKITGGSLPAKIWRSFMSAALKDLDAAPLPSEYDDGFFSLPWLQSSKTAPNAPPPAANGAETPADGAADAEVSDTPSASSPSSSDAPPADDAGLGKSFWDKLMGDDDAPPRAEPSSETESH